MCLWISPTKPHCYIAGYDILVYKAFDTGLRSPFRGYKWTVNKPVKRTLSRLKNIPNAIGPGLHAFIKKPDIGTLCGWANGPIQPAIIPKGSKFYIGLNNEIVSNCLVIKPLGWDLIPGNCVPKGKFSKHKIHVTNKQLKKQMAP